MTTTQPVSRRSIAKGTAWSIPAVAIGVSAPAMATSPVPAITSHTFFIQGNTSVAGSHYACDNMQQYEITNTAGSPASGYINVTGLTPGAKLSGLTATYWLPVDKGTTFSPTRSSSACWTTPTAVSGGTIVRDGVSYYAYTSNYTCPITVTDTSWSMPAANAFDFVSSCQNRKDEISATYHYTQHITVNGATLTKDNSWDHQTTRD